jgi:hypothetical protein
MATYLSGGVRKATPNTVTAMRRSAENRRCPACQRKSALVFVSDAFGFGHICRWCKHSTVRPR